MKKLLRNLRIWLGKMLLDTQIHRYTDTQDNRNSNIKRILFLRQDGKIGDYIVSSFVFRELKKISPNLHIGIVCTKKDAYLYNQNPYIDQIHCVKKRDIIDYIRCGLMLRKAKYDIVVDPTIFIRNRDLLLLRLIKANQYVGYKKSDYRIFNVNIEGEYHFSELYRIALEKVGFHIHNTQYDVPFNQDAQKEIIEYLEKNNIKNYIAVNFYGAARTKKVNNQNIPKYLAYLQKICPNRPLVLLSYPEVMTNLRDLSAEFDRVFVHETTTIFHTIELIRHCDQIISTDTSTVHIASGFNKKIIAIYREDPIAFIHWKPMSRAETHILYYQENINEINPEQIEPHWLN